MSRIIINKNGFGHFYTSRGGTHALADQVKGESEDAYKDGDEKYYK
jgi:hypothetical protein